jgi:ABC-type nitrate/sulfonate/bicarbonate transport system substrate-binding protein
VGLSSLTVGTSPPALGAEMGFFQAEGLNTTRSRIDNVPLTAGVSTGALDIGEANPWNALALIAKGQDLKSVGAVLGGSSYSIVARPEITSVEQLRGAKIALGEITIGQAAVTIAALERVGLPPGSYENVSGNSTTAQKAALMSQKLIDATVLAAPTSQQIVADGFSNVLDTWEVIPVYAGQQVLVSARWAETHQDVLVRYLRAVLRSLRWVNDPANENEFVERASRLLDQDPTWVREGFRIYQANHLWPQNAEVSHEALQFAIDYLDRLDALGGPKPSVSQVNDDAYLQRAMAAPAR